MITAGSMLLNGTWELTWAEGAPLVSPDVLTGDTVARRHLLRATVPAPIHQVLQDTGLLDDPNVGLNSLKARWVEEQFWVYRHTFTVPAEALATTAWLIFTQIELDAEVRLNGEVIGTHANAHRPAIFNVAGKLRAGENLLVVTVSTGLHRTADKSGAAYVNEPLGQLTKRIWRRSPQHQAGWDWHPRLMNVGILGDVRLEWHTAPRLDQVTVYAIPDDDLQAATVHVRAHVANPGTEPVDGVLRARITETGQTVQVSISIPAGESSHEATLRLEHPRLWWPVGHGEQALYTIAVTLEAAGETQSATRRTGVRAVEVDQSVHPVAGRYFILTINGRRIFCKGGNWVPADLLYSQVTPERYRELVDLAVQANFNLLRVWGGASFAPSALCEACDEAGILLWQDFLFACCKYPGDDPDFLREVTVEMTRAVRAMAHHPSLVVWCGNNEIEWFDEWGAKGTKPAYPHHAIFHQVCPKIVREEGPSAFYWPASPWSPDYQFPNDPTCGDQHPWGVSIFDPGAMDWWRYRDYQDRFADEGGVLGASTTATLRQFLPEPERHLWSHSWEHHDNPMGMVAANAEELPRVYETVRLWTGRDPRAMPMEEYAILSGLLHAEGLVEYIGNYRRRMFDSAAAIFWMYNDSWPVTHGWTIVDYYRRKKLAYHPVRRAFQPVTVVVATTDDGQVTVFGVNDSPQEWTGTVRYGLFTLDGARPVDEAMLVTIPANSALPLAATPVDVWQSLDTKQTGAFAVLLDDGRPLAQHRLFLERFTDLAFTEPQITMRVENGILELLSDVFVWGVCLDVDGDAPVADNCFDLVPGIPYCLPWDADHGAPTIAATGNMMFHGTLPLEKV